MDSRTAIGQTANNVFGLWQRLGWQINRTAEALLANSIITKIHWDLEHYRNCGNDEAVSQAIMAGDREEERLQSSHTPRPRVNRDESPMEGKQPWQCGRPANSASTSATD